MSIFGWIFFGFIIGLLARGIMPERDPLGVIGTTMLGMSGALIAGWIGQALGWYRPDQGASFVAATIGSITLIGVYYTLLKRQHRYTHKASSQPIQHFEDGPSLSSEATEERSEKRRAS